MTPEEVIAKVDAGDAILGPRARRVIRALNEAGYVIVPRRPTKEMYLAAMPFMDSWSSNLAWWDAILGAV